MKKQKIELEVEVPDGMELDLSDFVYTPKFKQITKIIDLQKAIDFDLDCEAIYDDDKPNKFISCGKVSGFKRGDFRSETGFDCETGLFENVRIRQSPHIHFWSGGNECPLPQGLKVKLYLTNKTLNDSHYIVADWLNICGFEILGVAEGWKYAWQN